MGHPASLFSESVVPEDRPEIRQEKKRRAMCPRMLAEAPVKMMLPRPSGTNRRAASRPTRKPLKQPTRQKSSNCSEVSSRKSMRFRYDELRRIETVARGHCPLE
jgi:hypothetical protein